ncbi:hypothetical protein B9G55_12705 [Saccharibacillus sp. O16]|nr:hypothetical protein B9G55_12705 [Saccharibacillus sp. O16]
MNTYPNVHDLNIHDMDSGYILLTVPSANRAAAKFLLALEEHGIPAAVLTDNRLERDRWERQGLPTLWCPDAESDNSELPSFPVRAVYVFEDTLRHTCSYLQFAAERVGAPIYVIAQNAVSIKLYKRWGASYVLCTHSDDVDFLIP